MDWKLSTQYFSSCLFLHLQAQFFNKDILKPVLISDFCPLAGGETEGSGSVGDVSFPNEEQRVDANPNQQLYIPEPVL